MLYESNRAVLEKPVAELLFYHCFAENALRVMWKVFGYSGMAPGEPERRSDQNVPQARQATMETPVLLSRGRQRILPGVSCAWLGPP